MRSARCCNSSFSNQDIQSSCTIDNYQQYVCAGVELWYLKPILFSPNSLFYSLVDNGLVGLGYLHINYIKIQFYSLINIFTNSFQDNIVYKSSFFFLLRCDTCLKCQRHWLIDSACCAGEIYTHKTVTCLNMFDDRNAKLGKGTF